MNLMIGSNSFNEPTIFIVVNKLSIPFVRVSVLLSNLKD